MTSEQKHVTGRMALARLQTAIYANRKLAFLVSILLSSSLVYLLASINDRSSSPYASKRYGLGAGAASGGELRAALKRKGDGRAAVAIIRVMGMNNAVSVSDKDKDPNNVNNKPDDVRYLVQVKSHDYPIEPFRGAACLLGGNANDRDETPLDTLKRELNEELQNPDWVDAMLDPSNVVDDSSWKGARGNDWPSDDERPPHDDNDNSSGATAPLPAVRYLGASMHFQSADLLARHAPYAFLCALYEITLRPEQLPPGAVYPRGANIREGRVVLLSEDQLVRHSKYAWGYEHTIERYFGKKVANVQKGTAVSDVDDRAWRETVWTPGN